MSLSYNGLRVSRYTPPYSKYPGFIETSEPRWYNPATKVIAVGEEDDTHPNWRNWVINVGKYAQRQQEVEAIKNAGGEDPDPLGTKLAGINPDYYSAALELMTAVTKAEENGDISNYKKYLGGGSAVKGAAILRREDFTALKTVMPQAKIISITLPKHVLRDLVPIDNNGEFVRKIYSWDGPFDVWQENLAEMSVPDITGFPAISLQEIGMERYGLHYAFSEEFLAETFDVDIKQHMLDNIVGQMDIIQNKKIADVLNAATFTGQGDWSAKTGTVSTRNPATDIKTVATLLHNTNKLDKMILASPMEVYDAFYDNSWINKWGTPQYETRDYSYGNVIATNIPSFPGLRWGIDTFMTAGKYVLFDPSAIYAAQMPQRTVDYQSPFGTHRGTIIRLNFIVKTIDTDRIKGGSSVL